MNYATFSDTATDGLLAQLNWQPLFEDHGFPLAIMGLFVVFSALMLVRIFIGTLPRIVAALDHFFPDQQHAPQSAAQHKATTDEIPDEILAVIAAVVAETVREPHRIVPTQDLSPEDLS
jgi:Na+-transporting methylmalonyl-CoA/oxaloacetate decarboxylase gamma subunit